MSFTIKLQRAIDSCIFSPLAYFFSWFKINSPFDNKKVKKILVIKLWALGDSVVLLPALTALKKEFPNAKIDVLAHKRNRIVFEGQKTVNKIIEFGAINILKQFRKYDLCIDTEPALSVSAVIAFLTSKHRLGFSHGIRAKLYHETVLFSKKQHMVQNYLDFARKVGSKYNTDELVPLVISNKDKEIVNKWLKKQKITNNDFVVGISAGVAESVKYRMWPINKTAEFADEVIKEGKKVIFVDSKSNKKIIGKIMNSMNYKAIDASGLFDIKQVAELIKRCNVFISNDSGLMHVSAAEKTPTVGLFGPNTPVLWGPYGKHNIAIFKPNKGCPYIDNTNPQLIPKKLTKAQLTVMDNITVNDVIAAVSKIAGK